MAAAIGGNTSREDFIGRSVNWENKYSEKQNNRAKEVAQLSVGEGLYLGPVPGHKAATSGANVSLALASTATTIPSSDILQTQDASSLRLTVTDRPETEVPKNGSSEQPPVVKDAWCGAMESPRPNTINKERSDIQRERDHYGRTSQLSRDTVSKQGAYSVQEAVFSPRKPNPPENTTICKAAFFEREQTVKKDLRLLDNVPAIRKQSHDGFGVFQCMNYDRGVAKE
jgi:uncharacterized protein (DUF2267 family)